MITISDSTIDVPIHSSRGRVDTMPKKRYFYKNWPVFGMISTLPLELWIGTSMMLFDMLTLVYYKVSEPS